MKCKVRFLAVIFFLIAFFGITYSCYSQKTDSTTFKIFLIGDAGEAEIAGPALQDLKTKLHENPNSAVVFLGDNCYKKALYGLIPLEVKGYDGSKQTKAKMMTQLDILRGYKGYAFMVPGNHDWWNTGSAKNGKKHLLKEQLFVEDTLRTFTTLQNYNSGTFLPTEGSPGPVSRDVDSGRVRIVFIDSYRLLLEESEKKKDSILLQSFYQELENQLADASLKKQRVVVVAHHPMYSLGKHSQPMRRIESMGKRFGSSNSNFAPYRRMNAKINAVLKKIDQRELYYASGHEHSLEYFNRDSIHYIVSGSGSKIDHVEYESCQSEDECLQWNEAGFFEIDFLDEKGKVIMYHRGEGKEMVEEININ